MKRVMHFILFGMTVFVAIIACDKREATVQPKACFTASPTSIYVGESVTFTDCSEDAQSYLWEFGDDKTSMVQNPVHKFDEVGDFVVILKVNNKELSDQTNLTIHVAELKKDEMIVRTSQVSDVKINSAKVSGSVTYDGTISAKGVCWNTSHNPIVSALYTNEGTALGNFTSQITGLKENTKYYVRAYATNSTETIYGEEKSFTTAKNIVLPTVSTNEITNITTNSATGGGNITNNGGAAITASGVCWNTSPGPTLSNASASVGATGNFTCDLTNLMPNTTYYVRAYAKNSKGTAYGNERVFNTKAIPAPPTEALIVPFISNPPTLDGSTVGDAWGSTWINLAAEKPGSTTHNMTSKFQLMHDANNIYLIINILDATPNNNADSMPDLWDRDCAEIFFSMHSPTDSTAYAEGDWQIRIHRANAISSLIDGSGTTHEQYTAGNFDFSVLNIGTTQYTIEAAFSIAALSGASDFDGVNFRFELMSSDNTTGVSGGRTQQLFWKDGSDTQWNNVNTFSPAFLK